MSAFSPTAPHLYLVGAKLTLISPANETLERPWIFLSTKLFPTPSEYSTPLPGTMLSSPCKICLDFDESLLQQPSRTRCTLDELCNSAPACSTCSIILRAVKHCFPEILLATSYFALSFSRFNGRHLQNPSETFGVTVSVEEDVVEEDLPEELVGQMFRHRELHIYTAKGTGLLNRFLQFRLTNYLPT
jgi:hypothetical protein